MPAVLENLLVLGGIHLWVETGKGEVVYSVT